MTICMKGKVAYLKGDWTLACLTKDNINSMAALLQQLETGKLSTFQIDCQHMTTTDATGLQLIKVWMQCMRMRGAEPELINPPDNLQQHFREAGSF